MIREARATDAAAIAEIYNRYVTADTASFETSPVSEDEMHRRIESISALHPYYVDETDGEITGFCYAHPWKERAAYRDTLETTIYISTRHLRRGIGRLLMTTLINECRNRGYHALIACITGGNEASCALHERLGFKQVSLFKEVGIKFGRRLDVVDYQLLLD